MEYAPDARSIGELFSDLTREVGTLIRTEVALARTELSEKASRVGATRRGDCRRCDRRLWRRVCHGRRADPAARPGRHAGVGCRSSWWARP